MVNDMVISSTQQSAWQTVSTHTPAPDESFVEILTGEPQQSVRGFGGCFSELGALALQELSECDRRAVNELLFSKAGCAFNFCRLPIGANDFAKSWYSYDETPGDLSLEHFSIKRDYELIIPWVKQAQTYCPQMQFMASPWSPPTWMKSPAVYNYGTLIWSKDIRKCYAEYLRCYVESYQQKGIPITQLHLQNEPISSQKFPSCIWSGERMRDFIRDDLAPAIGDKTDLWLGTLNGPASDERAPWTRFNNYAHTVLQDKKCRKIVKGVGYQWGGKLAIQQTHDSYPELELIQTESECGNGANSWEYAMYVYELIHHYFRNGASAYLYWNMVLDANAESTWGWKQNSLITVCNNSYRLNPELYLIWHFAHFVQRGAVHLKSCGEWAANTTAFQNPDGSLAIVVMNPFNSPQTVRFQNKYYTLPARSFSTLTGPPLTGR